MIFSLILINGAKIQQFLKLRHFNYQIWPIDYFLRAILSFILLS